MQNDDVYATGCGVESPGHLSTVQVHLVLSSAMILYNPVSLDSAYLFQPLKNE